MSDDDAPKPSRPKEKRIVPDVLKAQAPHTQEERTRAKRKIPPQIQKLGGRLYGAPKGRPGKGGEVEVPVDGHGTRAKLYALPNPPALGPEHTDAPPPPPGYRYDLRGRLVPLLQTRHPVSTPQAKKIFLEILELTGNIRAGLDALGLVSLDTIARECEADPKFTQQIEIAIERHRQGIYAAAFQRAVNGYNVPIVGGQFKDQVVAYERRYSDSLMALLLKRHFPEFREAAASTTTKVTINNANQPVLKVDLNKLSARQRASLRNFLADSEIETQLDEEREAESEEKKEMRHLSEGAIDAPSEERK